MIKVRIVIPKDQPPLDKLFEHRITKFPLRFSRDVVQPIAHAARKKGIGRLFQPGLGRVWAPLSPVTVKRKKELGMHRGILIRTRALKRSLTIASDPRHYTKVTRKRGGADVTIDIGSKDPVFLIHHEGAPSQNIPQRHLLPNVSMHRAWSVMVADRQVMIPMVAADLRRPMSAR
jgi:hypothetical protein